MAVPERSSTPDLNGIRARLNGLIDTLARSTQMPLSDRDLKMWRIVVPNMTKWLPDDEAAHIRSMFIGELKRLGFED